MKRDIVVSLLQEWLLLVLTLFQMSRGRFRVSKQACTAVEQTCKDSLLHGGELRSQGQTKDDVVGGHMQTGHLPDTR